MTLQQLKQELLDEFDEEFEGWEFDKSDETTSIKPNIKSFLSSAIDRTAKQTAEEVIEEIHYPYLDLSELKSQLM